VSPGKPKQDAVEARLLAQILADPDDAGVRLAYADRLLERQDPRGQLISIQCAAPGDDAVAKQLTRRANGLIRMYGKRWMAFGHDSGAPPPRKLAAMFRRGFIEKLEIDADWLVECADVVFATEPVMELHVRKLDWRRPIHGRPPLAAVLALPLGRVRRLAFPHNATTTDDFAALADATTLGGVEALDLAGNWLVSARGRGVGMPLEPLEVVARLALPRLCELSLHACFIGDAGAAVVAASRTLRPTRLDLSRCKLTADGCRSITEAAWAGALEYLDISGNRPGEDGIAALATSPRLAALHTLVVPRTVGSAGPLRDGLEIVEEGFPLG
jgi:uncharacterized protein (TIGR02996 family)